MITISLPLLEHKLEGRGHNCRLHSCTHRVWCRKDAQIKMVALAPKMSLIKLTHIKDVPMMLQLLPGTMGVKLNGRVVTYRELRF